MVSNDSDPATHRIELRHLRYFVAVAEGEHMSRAAEGLAMSPSTLSHQIRQLEEALGAPLFDRVGRGLALTQAGRTFLGHARRALGEVEAGREAVTELSQGRAGRVRIGVIHTFHNTLLPPLMAEHLQCHPGVRLLVEEHPAGVIEEMLCAGRLDLGLAFAPPSREGIVAEPVFDEELVLAVARRHPLARRRQIQARELEALPLALLTERFATRHLIDRTFESVVRLEPRLELASVEAQINIVVAGGYAAILPARAAARERGIARLRIVNPTPIRTAALLWPPDKQRSAAARSFARLFAQAYAAPPHS